MFLQTRKLHFIESILSVGNEKVIEKLEALLKKEQDRGVSIEQYNREIEEANGRIESGEYTSHDDVKRESKTWLK